MDETFALKQRGHLSLGEQAYMTAEDRRWWLKKLDEENSRKEGGPQSAPDKLPPAPGQPPS